MKIALFGTKRYLFSKAYTPEVLKKLGEYGELSEMIDRNNLDENAAFLADCDVISNHLANKPELENIFNRKLFRLMKKRSTFINTGRGAQVAEYQLALSLLLHPSRTFVADVLKHESFPYINPLFWCPNAILTPHIAGSMGKEPQRMAYYMMEEMDRMLADKPVKYEVTLESLERMA